METFLVEHYQPGWSVEMLEGSVSRIRAATGELRREGKAVHLLRSTIVPDDESLLCVFEAASRDLVDQAYLRAGATFERISPAISTAGSPTSPSPKEE